jgi:hypothetical protein
MAGSDPVSVHPRPLTARNMHVVDPGDPLPMRKKNTWNGIVGLLLAASVVLASGAVHAEPLPQVTLGPLAHAGSGCPPGTVTAMLGGGGQVRVIDFRFDALVGQAGMAPPPSCNVNVPIQVDPGTRLRIRNIGIRGNAAVPAGGRGSVRGNFQLGSCPPIPFFHMLPGPISQAFGFLQSGTMCQTPCGTNTLLRGLIYAAAQSPPAAPGEGTVAVEYVRVQLELVRC